MKLTRRGGRGAYDPRKPSVPPRSGAAAGSAQPACTRRYRHAIWFGWSCCCS